MRQIYCTQNEFELNFAKQTLKPIQMRNNYKLLLLLLTAGTLKAQTYGYTGAVQTFTVPACVTTITVDMVGASGGTTTRLLADSEDEFRRRYQLFQARFYRFSLEKLEQTHKEVIQEFTTVALEFSRTALAELPELVVDQLISEERLTELQIELQLPEVEVAVAINTLVDMAED